MKLEEVRPQAVLGRQESVAVIHGGVGREERLKTQEAFRHDPTVQVLLATDAAAEGINLQRAHLMVNYDLPWNPNRLEQRFGRIHRIGQTEVCHLWNLVADQTREGDVYRTLLDKLEQARQTLGGQVFDVRGKLQFEGRALRDLLLDAIRHGERPEVRAHLTRAVEDAFDRDRLRDLLEERDLAQDAMDTSRVPATGKLRFIEVKGRAQDKATITVTCNEILYSLNKPDDFILAIVEFLEDGSHRVRYLRRPFRREPDFGVTSVNHDFPELLARAEDPA